MTARLRPHLVLRACPFCGSGARIDSDGFGWWFWPSCTRHGCLGELVAPDDRATPPHAYTKEQEAADDWNQRADASPPPL